MNEIYEYLRKYPDDILSYAAFLKIDTSNLNEQELEDYNNCKEFVDKHRDNCICLGIHARHPFYRQSIEENKPYSVRMTYKIDQDRIFLNFDENWDWDCRHNLLDFVLMPDKELRIGFKHYWMADEATFVYGAGRMMISPEGSIEYIDNHSGHYLPNADQFRQTLNFLSYLDIKHYYVKTDWQ